MASTETARQSSTLATYEQIRVQVTEDLCFHTDAYSGRPDIQADIIQSHLDEHYGAYGAAERIAPFIAQTPLQPAASLSAKTGNRVLLKREDLQPINSFKIRGAASRMTQLTQTEKQAGVATVSAGNHAQGVAVMAQKLHIPATIFMPVTTPDIKVEAVKAYGAMVETVGDDYSQCFEAFNNSETTQNATYIHAFADQAVRDGNGTIGLEILRDEPTVSHIFVPIGGGGLISGVAKAVKALRPDVTIIGVQYDQSNAMQQSVAAGQPVRIANVGIFSGGTAVAEVDPATLADTIAYVDDIVTVSEDETVLAITDFYQETRSFLEPAGALAIAGLKQYCETAQLTNATLAAITSGANIDPSNIGPVFERAALLSGKRALLSIRLPERAGALERLCSDVIGQHNIRSFDYAYNGTKQANILIELGLADAADKEKVLTQLAEHSYAYVDHSTQALEQAHAGNFVGGPSKLAKQKEALFQVTLPSKPGALLGLLESVGRNQWDISRFSYRSSGTEEEQVFIGFAVKNQRDMQKLQDVIAAGIYGETAVAVEAKDMQQFIGKQLARQTVAS